jgi:hypothetical protein
MNTTAAQVQLSTTVGDVEVQLHADGSRSYSRPVSLVGLTTRPVRVARTHPVSKLRSHSELLEVGSEVYVSRIREDGTCEIRVPGTLLTQRVYLSTVSPA